MGRFGRLTAIFYDSDDLTVPVQDTNGNSYLYPVSARTEEGTNSPSRTEVVFHLQEYWDELVTKGRKCALYYSDEVMKGESSFLLGVPFAHSFTIQEVGTTSATVSGEDDQEAVVDTMVFSGEDITEEFKYTKTFFPIAELTDISTTIATTNAEDISSTTVAVGAPANNDSIILDDATGADEGDELRVVTNEPGVTHITLITSVNPPESPANTLQYADRMPYNSDAGNAVEIRTATITVDDTEGFAKNMPIWITLNDASVWKTFVDEVDHTNSTISILNGLPDGADIGNAVVGKDYSQVALDDIDQAMALLSGWSVIYDGAYTGTADGTRHSNDQGNSVHEILQAAARQTGEYFHLRFQLAGVVERELRWKRAHNIAGNGGNHRLVMPTQDVAESVAANANRGYITGTVHHRSVHNPITRVYPFAGDDNVTLHNVTSIGTAYALLHGYTIVTTGLDEYEPPYIRDNSLETDPEIGVRAGEQTFSNIRAESDKIETIQTAADSLAFEAVNYLFRHQQEQEFYDVNGVINGRPIYIGDRVELVYTEPTNLWSISKTGSSSLYVLGVSREMNDDGIPYTSFRLATTPYEEATLTTSTASAIATVNKLAKGAGGAGSLIVVNEGGTGSSGSHGSLSGLGNDDHAQYLLTDGSRTLTGNLAVTAGKTIDGIDISAHAADAAAHHDQVTLSNTGLSLSGQALGVRLSTPSALNFNAGLEIGTGIAGDGLSIAAQVMDVDILPDSGMTFSGGRLTMGTPQSVGFATSNGVSGTGHTHNVLTTDDGDTFPETILNADASGRLQLSGLSLNTAIATQTFHLDGRIEFEGGDQINMSGTGTGSISNNSQTLNITASTLGLVATQVNLNAATVQVGQSTTITGLGDNKNFTIDPGNNITLLADGVLTLNAVAGDGVLRGDWEAKDASGITYVWYDEDTPSVGIGVEPAGNSILSLRSMNVTDYALYVRQLAGQDAEIVRFEDSAGDALVILTKDGDLESGNPGFVSGLTGWQITHDGDAEFNNAWIRGELHATVFVADEMHATGGTLAILTATKVSQIDMSTNDNKLPAVDGTFTLVLDGSWDTGLSYFADNDIIRIKTMTEVVAGGSLDLYDIYLEVSGTPISNGDRDLSIGNPGTFDTQCVRRSGGIVNLRIPSGAAAVKWGEVDGAGGTYTGGIILTSDLNDSPYIDVFTVASDETGSWPGAGDTRTPPTITPRVRVGNLDGVLGLGEEWGIALGTDLSDTSLDAQYIVASDQRLRLNNVDLEIYDSSNNKRVLLNSDGDLLLGTDVDSVNNTLFSFDGSTGVLELGDRSNYLRWSSGDLHIGAASASLGDGLIFMSDGLTAMDELQVLADHSGDGIGAFSVTRLAPNGQAFVNNLGSQMFINQTFDTAAGSPSTLNIRTISTDTGVGSELATIVMVADKSGSTSSIDIDAENITIDAGITLALEAGTVSTTGLTSSAAVNVQDTLTADEVKVDNGGLAIGSGTTIPSDGHLVLTGGIRVGAFSGEMGVGNISADGGLTLGHSDSSVNDGQLISDLEGNNHSTIVLRDSVDITHGMTSLAETDIYAQFRKVADTDGGLEVRGFTEDTRGIHLLSRVTSVATGESTSSDGAVYINAAKKSGTSATTLSSDDNMVVLATGGNARVIFKGDGDIWSDGSSSISTFDDYDDPALLRSLRLAVTSRRSGLESTEELMYNHQDLEAAGLVNFHPDGTTMVNQSRINGLSADAIWQLAERLNHTELTLKRLERILEAIERKE